MNKIFGGNKLLFVEEILNKAKIKEGMKIADFGCGPHGYFIFNPSAIVGKRGIVYAVDIVKNILSDVENKIKLENYKNIKTVWANLEKFKSTKIESMSLDLVFLVNVLHQSEKKIEILREGIRVLKKGARLFIVDWNNSASLIGPESEKKVNKDNLIIALNKLGLTQEDEFVAGKFHFGLVFKKL